MQRASAEMRMQARLCEGVCRILVHTGGAGGGATLAADRVLDFSLVTVAKLSSSRSSLATSASSSSSSSSSSPISASRSWICDQSPSLAAIVSSPRLHSGRCRMSESW
eukprot:CAMPEP_0179895846 /NCGR_PEP_ID=MMETSP0982-20121206/36053_1 /TAXON_ID=483367 /ORGANISM="non described non described, Strain CCMP 2436" /LENGTH=107 /DNA_ID=CAMNT_0021792563 /DNA_START=330 /DNA_END=650 /DNA_ORIENTATION=+